MISSERMRKLLRRISEFLSSSLLDLRTELEPWLDGFFKYALLPVIPIYGVAIFLAPQTLVIIILFSFLTGSVVGLNWYAYGWQKAKWRIAITAFLGGLALIPSLLVGQANPLLGLWGYMGLWVVAAAYGFLWPTYEIASQNERRSFGHLCMLFMLVISAGLGSTYIPMRAVVNEVQLRTLNPNVQERLEADTEALGSQAAVLKFQTDYLFDTLEPLDTTCSRNLTHILHPILQPDELALHATAAYWIDQFLKNIWGVRDIAGCRISNYEAKRSWSANTIATHAYSAFISFLWAAFLYDLIVSIISRPFVKNI